MNFKDHISPRTDPAVADLLEELDSQYHLSIKTKEKLMNLVTSFVKKEAKCSIYWWVFNNGELTALKGKKSFMHAVLTIEADGIFAFTQGKVDPIFASLLSGYPKSEYRVDGDSDD